MLESFKIHQSYTKSVIYIQVQYCEKNINKNSTTLAPPT